MCIKHFHSILHVFLPPFYILLLLIFVLHLGNFIKSVFQFTNFSFHSCLICRLTYLLSFFFLKNCFPIYKLHLVLFQICQLFTKASLVAQGKESACRRCRRWGSLPGLGRPPGEGNDNSLQCSCQYNPTKSLAGYSPWGCKESDTTEHAQLLFTEFYSFLIFLFLPLCL